MGEAASNLARKMLAVAVLAVAAYVLFKMILGFVTAIAGFLVVIVALFAIAWAVRTL